MRRSLLAHFQLASCPARAACVGLIQRGASPPPPGGPKTSSGETSPPSCSCISLFRSRGTRKHLPVNPASRPNPFPRIARSPPFHRLPQGVGPEGEHALRNCFVRQSLGFRF